MSVNAQRHALMCVNRLRAIIEHGSLTEGEMMRLAAELNELLERHAAAPPGNTQEAAC